MPVNPQTPGISRNIPIQRLPARPIMNPNVGMGIGLPMPTPQELAQMQQQASLFAQPLPAPTLPTGQIPLMGGMGYGQFVPAPRPAPITNPNVGIGRGPVPTRRY